MRTSSRTSQDTVLNGINTVAGLVLLCSPWIFGFTGTSAAWNAWIVGAIIAIVAVSSLVALQQWEEWANVVLGVWAFVAPCALGFSALTGAVAIHVVVGLIVAVLAAIELWSTNNRPMSTT
jgi:heme/copper-type cytochrome/quinol oxidase subunit 3